MPKLDTKHSALKPVENMPSITLSELDKQTKPPAKAALDEHDPDKVHLDIEKVFLLYATTCGDVEATAAALGVPAVYIVRLAEAENWNEKLAPIIARKKSARPGDVERSINRAINFTIAHRYRTFLERIMKKMLGWSDDELSDFLVRFESSTRIGAKPGEGSVKIQSRALADFAVALQKCQEMSYMALNDTTPERGKRKDVEGEAELSLSAIHAQLARGMSDANEPKTGVGQLMAAQIERTQETAREAVLLNTTP